jgi:hypothetical protein
MNERVLFISTGAGIKSIVTDNLLLIIIEKMKTRMTRKLFLVIIQFNRIELIC